MVIYNPLHSYSGYYRTPCGRKTYVNGIARQSMHGGDTLRAAALRHIKLNPLRRVDSDLKLTFTEIEKGFEQ